MTSLSDRRLRLLSVLVAAAAALPPAARGAEKVKLEMKYLPGKYLVSMAQDMDQEITVAGQEQQQKISSLMVMEMEVEKPDPRGARKAKIIYKRIKQSMQVGAMSQEFDSADPAKASGPLAAGFQPLVGAEITLTIDPNNQITDVSGLDEILDKQARDNPAAARTLRQMKKSMGKSLKDMVSLSARVLPDKPIAPGGTWNVETPVDAPMIGKMKIKQTCTLQKIERAARGRTAVIAVKGNLKSEKPTTTEMGPVRLVVNKIDMTYEGTLRHLVELGLAESSVTEMKGVFDMALTAPDGQSQPMAIKMTGTVKVTAKKLPDW